MKKVYFILLVLLITASACSSNQNPGSVQNSQVKNIILFIGDGMGVAHVYAAMSSSPEELAFEKFPYSGFSKTYSADSYITDSGAGGTAIACGVKTRNGMIGIKPDSTETNSVLEIAHDNGLSTGVVSTSAITHATPASFVAHDVDRDNYEEIAADFLKGKVDVFIGGGMDHFKTRKDGADLTDELKKQGFDVVYTLDDMNNSGSEKIAGLLAKEHMPMVSDGRDSALSEMTRKAIQALSKNNKGFFLMVEGSQVDWGAHENNIDYLVSETQDLSKAIGVALDYAYNDGNTLVVVTADHETGGLTLTGNEESSSKLTASFSTKGHTGVIVPIFSFGPGAERFSGIHENTFFFDVFLDLLNIE